MPNTPGVILRILATASLCLGFVSSGAAEFRGLWVDAFGPGFFNAEQVRKLAADCRKYNFNAVVVEMRRRGDAFYQSNYDPRTTIICTNFDALAEIIKVCHTGTPRIEVHCWVVSHFIWAWDKPPKQPSHIFNRHPDYLTRDSIGQKFIGKGYFLDPGNPDANLTICSQAAYMNTKENTLAQLEYVRQRGFPGTVLYSYRSPNQGEPNQAAVFAFLKERFQPEWVETPVLPWKKGQGIIKGTVTRGDTRQAVYNAVVTLGTGVAPTQQTEPHGKYAFFDLSPGKYAVRAEARDGGSATESVEIKPGQVVNLNLPLRR